MNLPSANIFRVGLLAAALMLCAAHGQNGKSAKFSMATPDRWRSAAWWPTKGTPSSREYTGPDACSKCHAEIAASQRLTPMFKAARLSSDLTLPPQSWQFQDQNYSYVLAQESKDLKFSINDRANVISGVSGTVDWVFGAGEGNQTYILKQKDTFLESRLSYYVSLTGLDITPGHATEAPHIIAQALGDPLSGEAIRRCFGCHSTASTVSGKFDPEHTILGVTCEACHGPGLAHVVALQTDQYQVGAGTIFNPKRLSPVDSVDFCGACHRTPVDVAVFMPSDLGILAIRFQPYRLEKSRCWGVGGDSRITCIACHDPHKPLEHNLSSYDVKCLSCHVAETVAQTKLAPACSVATRDCASCHMPKLEIPSVHTIFTDHYIRIVRPGSTFRE